MRGSSLPSPARDRLPGLASNIFQAAPGEWGFNPYWIARGMPRDQSEQPRTMGWRVKLLSIQCHAVICLHGLRGAGLMQHDRVQFSRWLFAPDECSNSAGCTRLVRQNRRAFPRFCKRLSMNSIRSCTGTEFISDLLNHVRGLATDSGLNATSCA